MKKKIVKSGRIVFEKLRAQKNTYTLAIYNEPFFSAVFKQRISTDWFFFVKLKARINTSYIYARLTSPNQHAFLTI